MVEELKMAEGLKMAAAEDDKEKSQSQKDYEQGIKFNETNDISQAAAAFHNALLGFEQENDENGVANASMRLADICIEKDEFEKALKYCDKAHEICSKKSDRFSILTITAKQAVIYGKWDKFDQAIPIYIELIDEYNATRNPQATVDSLEALADLYIKTNNKDKAADCYKTIASIHKSFKHDNFYDRFQKKAADLLA